MSIRLNTLVINEQGQKLNIPKTDEYLIKESFISFVNDPELFKIKRVPNFDKAIIAIGIIALGALAYLISANKFFEYPGLSYSLIAFAGLGIIKVGYRQYCISKCKQHIYIAFAIIALRPHLNKIVSCDIERYRDCRRLTTIKDMYDGMGYIEANDGKWDQYLNTRDLGHAALCLRPYLSVNPRDVNECFKDVYDPQNNGTMEEFRASIQFDKFSQKYSRMLLGKMQETIQNFSSQKLIIKIGPGSGGETGIV